ncbi:nucleotidyltransferase family protein [Pararobbsia silviterrae]|uniref:Nucleotidyltransferase family protein n=1 Tax=Pararobbsia silviterrae TaxID=1792498 RepID=A0A494YB48_9BURK|nr:nucleotidyltransferase family protein [Pararobbsia silviterrae]RKP59395.1 nucleotidyltransferase family protein [Pararobbsia silviterrae]
MRHRESIRPDLPVGILLAAGRGARFDPAGARNKLTEPMPAGPTRGLPVAFVAARRLRSVLPRVVAVVRPGTESPEAARHSETLQKLLAEAGCEVVVSADAERGMNAALAAGVRASANPHGWLVALADMPAIAPATILEIAQTLVAPGARAEMIVAPRHAGRRGHPVGFGAAHEAALAALDGDDGARGLLDAVPVTLLDTLDAGVLRDIDTPSDLDAVAQI